MSAVDDVETQKMGLTAVAYSSAGEFVKGKTDLRTVSAAGWLQHSLPFRLSAVHYCLDTPAERVIVNFSLQFLDKKIRARTKVHIGTSKRIVMLLTE